jgi:DNA invertase Pin-like site-specific DNA recombinase
VFTILSAVAERDRTRERIAEVKDDQRQRNRYLGGDKPFGFDVKDGELVPLADEHAAIRRMVKLRAKGARAGPLDRQRRAQLAGIVAKRLRNVHGRYRYHQFQLSRRALSGAGADPS